MRFDWKPESKERYPAGRQRPVFHRQRNGQGTFQADFKRRKDTPMVGGKEND